MIGSVLLAALAASLTLECRQSEIRFADAASGYAVTGIVDRASGVSFLSPSRGKSDFWAIDFQRKLPNGSNELARIDNHVYAHGHTSRVADGVAEFKWSGINLKDEKGVVDVTARVRFDPTDGLAHWTLDVANRSAHWALTKTTYPFFREIAPEGAADVLMPGNNLGASLCRHHVSTNNIYDGVWNPGSHPMVAAWHLNGVGLYVAAHDGESRLKKMTFLCGEQAIRFETPVENAGVPGKAARSPGYEVVTGTYHGDWWRAAKIYRAWALQQKWARKGPIVRRQDYPKRLSDTHLWFLKHEDSLEASDAFVRARMAWPDVNLAAEITCWNPLPFDVGYPEYFPASAGVSQAIAKAKLSGMMIMPYMNGRLWDVDIPSFATNGAPDACRDENGELYVEKWNKKRNTFAIMCPTAKGWSDKVNDNVRRVVGKELGGSCIYLDQITASRSRACYNPAHGHPLGGGHYWADGYRAMLERAHRSLAAQKVPLTSEGAGDTWLDCIDGYLLAVIPEPTDVPFYTAVYSGYATYFGCRLLADASAEAFWAVETQATLNGIVPGWTTAFTLMKGREDFVKTLDRLGKFRQANAGFLAYGTLEDELRFVTEPARVKIEWDNLRQKIHYAPELPSIAGSVWRNPAGDADGVALANVSDVEQTAMIRLPSSRPFAVETADGDVSFVQEGAVARVKLGPRALAFVRTARAAPAKDEFDVYLLIGQSNMAGRGELTEANRVSSERVLKLDAAGEWTAGVEPLHWDKPVAGGGPGASFARRMADANPGQTIGLVPCADGGTALELWMPGRYLYCNAVRRAKEAMKTGRLKGILWHQGEADATERSSANYGERLTKMVTALRRDLGVGDIPFVAGELSPFLDRLVAKNGTCAAWRTINAQLHDFAKKVPNVAVVSAEGLNCNADLIHVDCASQRVFGERYAAAMKRLSVESDAPQRRYALWQMFESDREAAFAWMEQHLDEPAPRVGVLMVELARRMPADRRDRFLKAFAGAQTDPVVRKEISRATVFPFRRDNMPVSQNPANDHPVTLVTSIPLPLDGWRFRHDKTGDGHLGKGAYYLPSCKPTECWPEVRIGCSWEDIPAVGRNYDGIGWYRLEWTLPPKPEGANVFELVFGGVDEEAWVWINGTHVGQHAEGISGWNKPFRFDVAKELRWGESNVIVVRVNDTENAGGIWKPVTLEALKCDF